MFIETVVSPDPDELLRAEHESLLPVRTRSISTDVRSPFTS